MPLPLAGLAVRILGGSVTRMAGSAAIRSGLQSFVSQARKGMVAPKLGIRVDTSGFDAAMREYMKFNKKAMSEIVNTKAYYIARNAVNATAAVEKSAIEAELKQPSRDYPNVSLGVILASKQGLTIEELIRIRQNTVNFLRSGWIASIREIERFVPKKGGPSYKKVKEKGQPKGGAKGAPKEGKSNFVAIASIWNSVVGGEKKHGLEKKGSPTKVQKILEDGLQKAINKEEASMRAYVEKKLNEGINKFNRR